MAVVVLIWGDVRLHQHFLHLLLIWVTFEWVTTISTPLEATERQNIKHIILTQNKTNKNSVIGHWELFWRNTSDEKINYDTLLGTEWPLIPCGSLISSALKCLIVPMTESFWLQGCWLTRVPNTSLPNLCLQTKSWAVLQCHALAFTSHVKAHCLFVWISLWYNKGC